jgi:N-terminal acetyltransferase B complex non-catalytic subunit
LSFLDFTTAVADWLEPYHDHIRPSPATVLAEAAKQTELKTGHPLKGVDISQNGTSANGHAKKEDEAPPVKEAPEIVSQFFDSKRLHTPSSYTDYIGGADMRRRFREVQGQSSPSEALHVATLTQEVNRLIFVTTLELNQSLQGVDYFRY